MKLTRILLPTDFSEHSYEGLRTAELLAHQSGAELLIVHVLDLAASGDLDESLATEAAKSDLEKRLCEIVTARPDLTVERTLLEGHTAEEIVRFARQRGVDLIVMGSHGRTGIPRVLLGSVATQVVHDAPCPVLTVRPRVHLRGDIKAWAHRKPQPREPRSPSSI